MAIRIGSSEVVKVYRGSTEVRRAYKGSTKVYDTYEEESLALFDRMEEQPNEALKQLINKTIKDLKDGGIWDLLDCFQFYGMHTLQASLLNWKADNFNATVVNTHPRYGLLGFGYTGTSYINIGFNPFGLSGINYTKNDAFLGSYSRGGSTAYGGWGVRETTGNYQLGHLARSSTYYRGINCAWSSTSLNSLSKKRFTERNDATNISWYLDKVKTDGVQASINFRDKELYSGAEQMNGAIGNPDKQIQIFSSLGGYLGETRIYLFQDIIDELISEIYDIYTYGEEMVIDGAFDASSNWLYEAAWSISDGKATYNDTIIQYLTPAIPVPLTVGSKYKVSFEISGLNDAGSAVLQIADQGGGGSLFHNPGSIYLGNGNYSFVDTCIRVNTNFKIYGMTASSMAWSLDNFSIKEVL